MGGKDDARLKAASGGHYFQTEAIIQKSHERGADELLPAAGTAFAEALKNWPPKNSCLSKDLG
ncbi:MAG: hypothetical protein L3J06_05710 [Cyclobacteriaceae bacterium]|nr:hypothetical protein [Cyclobacteriaceae bacterium]